MCHCRPVIAVIYWERYSVFLAPIAGILLSDFWIVKRQNIDVPALYDPEGRYSYWSGINWRALTAFLAAVIPNVPGLANSIKSRGGDGNEPGLNIAQGIIPLIGSLAYDEHSLIHHIAISVSEFGRHDDLWS